MPVLVVQAGPAPTAKHLYASKNARIEENASRRTRASANMAGSMRIVPLLFARRRVATAGTARDRTRARAPRNGVEKIAEHRSVNRNARMGEGAWPRTRANVPRSGTATTVVCPYVIKVNLKLMGRRRPGPECPKTNRLVWTYDRGPGPCIDPASSRSGATRRKVLIVRNRKGPIRSWRPSPVRTTST